MFRALITASVLAAAVASTAPLYAQGTARKPLVVVITIDGFPARALNDPRLPMPMLRELIHDGAVSKGMIPVNPTVTWPNHTTLITGVSPAEHHVVANGLVTFPAGGGAPVVKPWVDKDELVHARTLYDAAAEAGMTVGQVDWVAIYGAKGVQWQFGEKPDPQSPVVQELVHQGDLTEDEAEHFGESSSPAWHDLVWTDAAVDILQHHTPNLLLMHLLETDSVQHEYGPLTPAAFAAYAYADSCLRRIVEAARAAAGAQNVTFFILSDHGFATYTHVIRPNVLLKQQDLITTTGDQTTGKVWVQAEGGAAEVFIRDDAERAALTTKLQGLFATVKGVEHVYTNQEAQTLDLPALGTTSQAPDLYLTADPDYAFAGGADGEVNTDTTPKGQHGYDNRNPDMQALFVASGAHIQAGVVVPVFPNLQVAPTIAKVLGVTLPAAKQPALDILR